MPSKSAAAWALVAEVVDSMYSGEPTPKTVVMSDVMFSSTVLATPTWPTSQPLRANETQGAGATSPFCPTMIGTLVEPVGSVQYANVLAKLTLPLALK